MAVLTNPPNRSHAALAKELKVVAQSLGVQLQVLDAPSPDQLDSAFAAMTKERVAALLVLTDSTFLGQQRRLTDLAGRSNLPALYSQKEFVVNGGLASYGPSLRDMYDNVAADTCRQDPEEGQARRHSDRTADEVRAGDQPQDREALGVTIPKDMLLRADEVIQQPCRSLADLAQPTSR